MIIRKTPAEIDAMARAGEIHVRTMNLLAGKIRAGVTTADLDAAAEKYIRSQGATPAFKGYRGFPGSICASPNHMVVHGIPGGFKLRKGDILSVDIGVVKDGWVADGARTFGVGEISPVAAKLLEVTEASLFDAVEQCQVGNRLGDVSHAVQERVEAEGFSVVRSLVGHGIGRSMHEEPQIPNYGPAGKGPVLEEGMVLAIEPMVTAGRHMVRMGDDGWAIYSQDGSLAAHFEFTVAITGLGPADPHAVASAERGRRGLSAALTARRDRAADPPDRQPQRPQHAEHGQHAGDDRLAAVALAALVAVRPRARRAPTSAHADGSSQRTPWNAGPRGESISPGTQPARVAPQRPS